MWFADNATEHTGRTLDPKDLQMIREYAALPKPEPWVLFEDDRHGRHIYGQIEDGKIVVTDYQDRVILDSFLHRLFVSTRPPWGALLTMYTYDKNGRLVEKRVRKEFNNGEIEEKPFRYDRFGNEIC